MKNIIITNEGCPFSNEEVENISHALYDCPSLTHIREISMTSLRVLGNRRLLEEIVRMIKKQR